MLDEFYGDESRNSPHIPWKSILLSLSCQQNWWHLMPWNPPQNSYWDWPNRFCILALDFNFDHCFLDFPSEMHEYAGLHYWKVPEVMHITGARQWFRLWLLPQGSSRVLLCRLTVTGLIVVLTAKACSTSIVVAQPDVNQSIREMSK